MNDRAAYGLSGILLALTDLDSFICDLARSIRAEALCADNDYCGSLLVCHPLSAGEPFKGLYCVSGIRATTKFNELCYVNFNLDTLPASVRERFKLILISLVRLTALPLLESFGHVTIDETDKGCVVRRTNLREEVCCHLVTPQMLIAGVAALGDYESPDDRRDAVIEIYRAMVMAAPKPPH